MAKQGRLYTNSPRLAANMFYWHRFVDYWNEFQEDYKEEGIIATWDDYNLIHEWIVEYICEGKEPQSYIVEIEESDLSELSDFCKAKIKGYQKALGYFPEELSYLKYTIQMIDKIYEYTTVDFKTGKMNAGESDWNCRFFYQAF